MFIGLRTRVKNVHSNNEHPKCPFVVCRLQHSLPKNVRRRTLSTEDYSAQGLLCHQSRLLRAIWLWRLHIHNPTLNLYSSSVVGCASHSPTLQQNALAFLIRRAATVWLTSIAFCKFETLSTPLALRRATAVKSGDAHLQNALMLRSEWVVNLPRARAIDSERPEKPLLAKLGVTPVKAD